MKKIKIILFVLGLFVMSSGCSDDFGDMNVDPNSTTKVEPKFFLNAMQQEVFANYQRNVNLYPDLYSQYWANTVSGFGSPRYEYVDGWIGNQWKEHYTRHLRQDLAMQEAYGDNEFFVDAIAIKEIWMCYWWSRMTDTYGDMPYFGAGVGDAVPYSSQQEIYADLFTRLNVAINNITGGEEQYNYTDDYDLIYGGDALQWRKFGNSLRLRLAMRISNADPEKAQAEAQAAVSGPGGLLVSNADVVKVPMWSKGWFDYLHQMAWNWNNIRMSKTFSNYLYNQSSVGEDPRAPKWFAYQVFNEDLKKVEPKTKEEAGFPIYNGIENGFNLVQSDADEVFATINLEGGYVDFVGSEDDDMYCPVMFYSEVKFLEAEAALRGWISGDANALYKEGVQASMDYVGVDENDATAYLSGLTTLTGANENQLKQIITQKWLANFPNGVEGWADFRRTDYPDITLPKSGVSGSSTVAAGTWVKRISYPDNAHQQDEENMPSLLNTRDLDRMDIRVWWDTADTKTKDGSGLMNSNF
ncbi:SusD/RagB family nutrient-binding outer membrane lipoprotein [Labilibaculum sp.]|uniref:SusD/RagB family nutrient-binding outer membrane lipoprotein n=1 Tax=Labilibaculum sp. TaxID=2060723 RepID=UPI002AA843C6|nr:SusD/RagB family nutrient-binding outer membrane lipoprotein [Labilibaculum sp.]MBN2597148.1 SusD/RagB family nutrient-binding outer membrane lipoprotein [Marinifilaceae bacterium]